MRIYSIFNSINGEVTSYHQASLATFIRFAGCNLCCSYCDTVRAQGENSGKEMTFDEVVREVEWIGCKNITITGGEPLLQFNAMVDLLNYFSNMGYTITVETNGSFVPYKSGKKKNICFVMDYKLLGSGMKDKMHEDNFLLLDRRDWIKMVMGSEEEYLEARTVMMGLKSHGCEASFAFSPVAGGKMSVQNLISNLQRDKLFDVLVNVQLHKYIWPDAGSREV